MLTLPVFEIFPIFQTGGKSKSEDSAILYITFALTRFNTVCHFLIRCAKETRHAGQDVVVLPWLAGYTVVHQDLVKLGKTFCDKHPMI